MFKVFRVLQIKNNMAQLIVSIENPSMITLAAIKDMEERNTIQCDSFETYKKLVSDL